MRQPYLLKKRGRVWYSRLAHEKTFHSTGQTSKASAAAVAQSLASQELVGAKTAPRFESYAADFYVWQKCEWIARQHAKGRRFSQPVARSRRSHLEQYLFPRFGQCRIDEINAVDVENWLVGLRLANQTKNHILYSLNIVMKEAKRERFILSNPLEDVEPMAKNFRERDVFSSEELRLLFPVNEEDDLIYIWGKPRYAALFFVLATTGVRSGEVRALRWRCVSWERGGLFVTESVKDDGKVGRPKNDEGRAIMLPTRTTEVLAWWRKQALFKEADDFLFPGSGRTNPITRRAISIQLRPAMERAGIAFSGRNLVVHSFRHTYNTLMRRVLPDELLRGQTGHRSIAMADRYDHPSLEERLLKLESLRPAVDNAWTGSGAGRR